MEEVDTSIELDYVKRNAALIESGMPEPKFVKTGTTIVGLTFKGGVVIGADSRATSGNIIADKYCVKLHRISDRIYASGAGTAADIHQVQRTVEANMTLLKLRTDREPYVINAVTDVKKHLFRYMGYVGAYLIMGGVDFDGSHLFNVHAGGSALQHSFVADGSGSLAAISILEKDYKLDMEQQDAIDLASKALMAGMESDLNSGNSYSYVVINEKGAETKTVVPKFCVGPKQAIIYDAKPDSTSYLVSDSAKIDTDSGFLFAKNRIVKKKDDEEVAGKVEPMEITTAKP